MPVSAKGMEEVLPAMNHNSSPMTARRNTRFVVRRGKIGTGGSVGFEDGRDREKRRAGGANSDNVPVPVLVIVLKLRTSVLVHLLPVWTMFAVLKNISDQIEVLKLFMWLNSSGFFNDKGLLLYSMAISHFMLHSCRLKECSHNLMMVVCEILLIDKITTRSRK